MRTFCSFRSHLAAGLELVWRGNLGSVEERRLRRGHGVRDAQLTVAGGITGATLAYLFDPRQGRRRRALVRDKLGHSLRFTVRRGNRLRRMLVAYVRGYGSRVAHALRPLPFEQPDDATLTQKVQSELFRPADVPKGQINVSAQNGVVQLRGEVPSPEMIRDLVGKTREIRGVRDVENLLHLPQTPAPMHQ